MDRKLLDKYFNDNCSKDELDQVLEWFQTEEGQQFLEQDIDRRMERSTEGKGAFSHPEIKSEKVFSRIQRNKKNDTRKRRTVWPKVASVMLLLVTLSAFMYWIVDISGSSAESQSPLATYVTASGQQKLFTLSDGTKIRLNEDSELVVSKRFGKPKRTVQLTGEAFFEVTHDEDHPFVVSAIGSSIEDLGTKFNVKTDSVARTVEVAVTEGKVSLKEEGNNSQSSAVLTKDHFGVLNLLSHQITIEKGNQRNYLSWITNKLVFDGQSLEQISRQLERLYDVNIQFKAEQLKKLNLTANFDKGELRTVLNIIGRTLDTSFKMNNQQVTWIENKESTEISE